MTLEEVACEGLVCEYKNCKQEGKFYNRNNRVVCKRHKNVKLRSFEQLFRNPAQKVLTNQQ